MVSAVTSFERFCLSLPVVLLGLPPLPPEASDRELLQRAATLGVEDLIDDHREIALAQSMIDIWNALPIVMQVDPFYGDY